MWHRSPAEVDARQGGMAADTGVDELADLSDSGLGRSHLSEV